MVSQILTVAKTRNGMGAVPDAGNSVRVASLLLHLLDLQRSLHHDKSAKPLPLPDRELRRDPAGWQNAVHSTVMVER